MYLLEQWLEKQKAAKRKATVQRQERIGILTDRCLLDAVDELQPVSTADLAQHLGRDSATVHYRLLKMIPALSWHFVGRVKLWKRGDGRLDAYTMDEIYQKGRERALTTLYKLGNRVAFVDILNRSSVSVKTLRVYLYDLRESGHVRYYRDGRHHFYDLTERGVKAAQRTMMVGRLKK